MKEIKFFCVIKILMVNLSLILIGCTVSSPIPMPSGENLSAVSTLGVTRIPSGPTSLPETPTDSVTLDIVPMATPSAPVQSITSTTTSTPQAIATETYISIPTPPGESRTQQVLWLYENNNGCQLPYWWGIIPGQTEWQVAQEFLYRFDSNYDIYETSSTSGVVYYGVSVILPHDVFSEDHTELGILTEHGIVERIQTRVSIGDTPSGYLMQYMLDTFLRTYGEPTEVWLSTYSGPFEHNDLPFRVLLVYPLQGIAALYSDNGIKQGEATHGCPQQDPVSVLSLWDPLLDLSFEEIKNSSAAFNVDFLSLEESTGMDMTTFYETFKNPDNTTCLETPANLWP